MRQDWRKSESGPEGAMQRTIEEIRMRRYLLGELPDGERAPFEELYLADAEFFEQLLALENDLIDSYVRGELNESESRRFEAEYLPSPPRRERVEFARALSQAAAMENEAARAGSAWKSLLAAFSVQQGVPRWALAGASAALLAACAWLAVDNHDARIGLEKSLTGEAKLSTEVGALQSQIAELEKDRENPAGEGHTESLAAKLEPPPELFPTLRLTPSRERGTGEKQSIIEISAANRGVRLQLVLERDDYRSYLVALRTVERGEIARDEDLASRSVEGNAVVAWRLPARTLEAGDYTVDLKGRLADGSLEDAETYSFRVLRR
jgi:hypothetical protein